MKKYLLYLASGAGSRFGANKLLADFGGKPLFAHGLEALAQAAAGDPECEIIVVSRYPEIRRWAAQRGLRTVDSPESDRGISHTIRAGIRSLETVGPEDFLLFLCADMPRVTPQTIRALLQMAKTGTGTARASDRGVPGNPVLFSAKLIPELLELQGDQGGGAVLRRHPCVSVCCQFPGELEDVDTPETLHFLQAQQPD